ncbi:MAG TPA: tRNA (adenosine(37)-N6)-threonylcarbamoyltransferase complex ATPase subunit type 1 TsaE [Planctomycetota bacterium]|nr:tRNA (adenosine(37)-N6)-threonylcarbamoyltransferase complex ATPase subunit type 1 TsaE [Planctomycetota bacterium]
MTFWLPDAAATERLGQELGRRLEPGAVLALTGDLGTGKTTLVRGLARGLGVDDPDAVASPTYLLVVEHPGRVPLVHVDAYLPGKLRAFLADGGLDYLAERSGVTAVEWADKVADLLPEDAVWLALEPRRQGGVDGRRAVLHNAGAVGDLAGLQRILEGP